MTSNPHIFHDEISDSLFRKMIRSNLFLISVVILLVTGVAFFIFHKVVEPYFSVQKNISLTEHNQILPSKSEAMQRYIRLLKSTHIRSEIIKAYNLKDRFGINSKSENTIFELDKALYDRLKVEEQKDGSVLVSYKDKSDDFANAIINDLAQLALKELNLTMSTHITWTVIHEKADKINPKFLSLLFLIMTPVLLVLIIFIAIKEKMYLGLNSE